MTSEQLRERTKVFAVRIVRLFQSLPNSRDSQMIGTQLLKSGTLMAAHYRRVRHSRSKADFVRKIGAVIEEADESAYWLELLIGNGHAKEEKPEELLTEVRKLLEIFNAARDANRKK